MIQWLIKDDDNMVVSSGRSPVRLSHAYDSAARAADAMERALIAIADGIGISQNKDDVRT